MKKTIGATRPDKKKAKRASRQWRALKATKRDIRHFGVPA